MALLQFNLQIRPLVGLYARIVRRELGLWGRSERFPGDAPFSQEVREDGSLFARSVLVALGQDFAGGRTVRKEFALAVDQRFRRYYDSRRYYYNDAFYGVALWAEMLGHSSILAEIVAGVPLLSDVRRLEIAEGAAAEAARSDYQELLRLGGDVSDFSPEGPLGPLWHADQPLYLWWRLETPDRWVTPMAKLGQPIWASERLSGDDVAYLVDCGNMFKCSSVTNICHQGVGKLADGFLLVTLKKPSNKVAKLLRFESPNVRSWFELYELESGNAFTNLLDCNAQRSRKKVRCNVVMSVSHHR